MFTNLTPHPIHVVFEGGEVVIPPSGRLARCKADRQVIGQVQVGDVKVPVTRVVMGELEGLPEPQEDTLYIVSLQAAQCAAKAGRTADVVVPDDAVRDKEGKIVGCRAFARQG